MPNLSKAFSLCKIVIHIIDNFHGILRQKVNLWTVHSQVPYQQILLFRTFPMELASAEFKKLYIVISKQFGKQKECGKYYRIATFSVATTTKKTLLPYVLKK